MDVRQRTFLLALVGLGLGVLVIIGVAVLLVRSSGASSAEAAQAREKGLNMDEERAREAQPPPKDESVPQRQRGTVSQPLVVYDGAVQRISCGTACFIEQQCGFREVDACRASSCEGEFRKLNRSDFQMGQADACAVLALIPCEEACWRRGECAGDHGGDAQCTAACITLGRQLPVETFRESRCVLESACNDLPLCGGLQERRPADAGAADAGPG